MSTTKEVKALLDELRHQLEPELAAYVEPILRKILEASKPKTVTEVEYRRDPQDKAEIESLRAAVASKDETIRKLQFKLAAPPPLLDHMTFDELLKEIDKQGRAWCECTAKCMVLAYHNDAFFRRRRIFLDRWLRLSNATVGNYLRNLEGCHNLDDEKIRIILDENFLPALKQIARDVHAASGVRVNLDMPVLEVTARAKVAAAQNVVVVGGGDAPPNGAPPNGQTGPPHGPQKPPSARRRRSR